MKILIVLLFLLPSLAFSALPTKVDGLISTGAGSFGKSTTADSKSILDLVSTTKGLLIPRMNTAQKNAIVSPPEGLLVFDTDLNAVFQFTGAVWESMGTAAVDAHIADTIDAHDATAISYVSPDVNYITSTEVQDALNQIVSWNIYQDGVEAALGLHTAFNAVDVHNAGNILNAPSGNLAALTVQSALNELQTDVDTRTTETYVDNSINTHLNDAVDAHDASAISSVPSGNLAALTVQSALNELQTDVDTRIVAPSNISLTDSYTPNWTGEAGPFVKFNNGTGENAGMVVEDTAIANAAMRPMVIGTGGRTNAADTDATRYLNLFTGANLGAGGSGAIFAQTGYVQNAGSGAIFIETGSSNGAASGSGRIEINTGPASGGGDRGNITMSAKQIALTAPQGLQIPSQAANPTSPTEGAIYYNTTTDKYFGYANGFWVNLGGGSPTAFTPTVSGANQANIILKTGIYAPGSGAWKSYAYVDFSFQVAGGAAGTGSILTVETPFTIDTAKQLNGTSVTNPGRENYGLCRWFKAGDGWIDVWAQYEDATHIRFAHRTGYLLDSELVDVGGTNAGVFCTNIKIPVSGW